MWLQPYSKGAADDGTAGGAVNLRGTKIQIKQFFYKSQIWGLKPDLRCSMTVMLWNWDSAAGGDGHSTLFP